VEPLIRDRERSNPMRTHPDTAASNSFQLCLQARPEAAFGLRQQLRLWLDELGAKPSDASDICLAATEALANAVEHPYQPSARLIDVAGNISNRVVTITIHDFGSWRDLRQREEGGYGFPIMRQLMDAVEVHTTAEGTSVTLQRRLDSPTRQ
jgi:serine/threonine-protein kinase RsbW